MVPNSFNDMFLFNAAVMGLSNNDWMILILDQLDAIALNVANPYRLQEECCLLELWRGSSSQVRTNHAMRVGERK